jgi:hypothetical protein
MSSEIKTKLTNASVTKFLDSLEDEDQRRDTQAVVKMMRTATGIPPKMWGSSIIGFDTYHYIGKSGREGDWFITGISPRKQALTLYVFGGWEQSAELLQKLGKHSLGKGCLYVKRLADVEVSVLKKLIDHSVKSARKQIQAGAADLSKKKKK